MMRQINLRVSEELLARIEVARGRVPRESWLRWAVEQALAGPSVKVTVDPMMGRWHESPAVEQASSETREPVPSEQADPGSVSSSEGVRPAAPAEQSYRSSSFAKRDVRPVPKRGA